MNAKPSRSIWKRFGETDGVNLVEAAIVLPLLISVMFAIVEFASILYAQMALQNGVNLAARYAITRQVQAGVSREAAIRTVMKRETPSLRVTDGQITFSNRPLTGGSWSPGTGGPNTIERITVTFEWPLMTPILSPWIAGGRIRIIVHATMKNESELEL